MCTRVWTCMMPQDCLAVWDIYIPAAVHRASTGVRSWRWCTSDSPHDCVQVCFQSCASASLFKAQHSLWTHGCLHNSGWDQSGRLEHLIVMWIDILLISRLSCGHNYYNDYNCYQVSGKSFWILGRAWIHTPLYKRVQNTFLKLDALDVFILHILTY